MLTTNEQIKLREDLESLGINFPFMIPSPYGDIIQQLIAKLEEKSAAPTPSKKKVK